MHRRPRYEAARHWPGRRAREWVRWQRARIWIRWSRPVPFSAASR